MSFLWSVRASEDSHPIECARLSYLGYFTALQRVKLHCRELMAMQIQSVHSRTTLALLGKNQC